MGGVVEGVDLVHLFLPRLELFVELDVVGVFLDVVGYGVCIFLQLPDVLFDLGDVGLGSESFVDLALHFADRLIRRAGTGFQLVEVVLFAADLILFLLALLHLFL